MAITISLPMMWEIFVNSNLISLCMNRCNLLLRPAPPQLQVHYIHYVNRGNSTFSCNQSLSFPDICMQQHHTGLLMHQRTQTWLPNQLRRCQRSWKLQTFEVAHLVLKNYPLFLLGFWYFTIPSQIFITCHTFDFTMKGYNNPAGS